MSKSFTIVRQIQEKVNKILQIKLMKLKIQKILIVVYNVVYKFSSISSSI